MPSVRLANVTPRAGGTASDYLGKPVTVKDPSRIISVASGAAEIVTALGLTHNLVGRDIASESPSTLGVPVVTDAHAVSVEKVLAQKPTLFIVDAQTSPTQALDAIARSGVQVIQIPQAWTLPDVQPRITALGAALGVPQQAVQLNTQLDITAAKPNKVRVAFLYLRGTASIYLLGGKGSGADAMITAAGGIDVGAQANLNPFSPLTPEALTQAQPDVLLVMTKGLQSVGGLQGLLSLPGVAQTPAGVHKRVIAVDDGLLLAFGVDTKNLIDALRVDLSKEAGS
jgi:iron complex transport system substrate-binding protein